MRICVPVRAPNGLESCIEPHLPHAEHLLFFDTETREIRHLNLRNASTGTVEQSPFDVVLCDSVDGATKQALVDQGILAFGTEARTAGEAIAEFEQANPSIFGQKDAAPDDVHQGETARDHADHAHEGGCGCGGSGQGKSKGGHGCDGRGGCGRHKGDDHGHDHDSSHEGSPYEGGCGCGSQQPHGYAKSSKMRAGTLKIAVSSQNRKTITDHAGRCRKFWVYEIRGNKIDSKTLRELSMEQTLHSSSLGDGHPLDDVHVMITTGMSPFLYQRLERGGIKPYVTEEADPDKAVELLLDKVVRSSAAPA